MTTDYQAKAQEIENTLAADGWALAVETIDAGGIERDSKFKVTISRNGRSFTTSYSMGWGFRRWKAAKPKGWRWGATTGNVTNYWDSKFKAGERIQTYGHNLKKPADCSPSDREHQQKIFDEFEQLTEPDGPTLADVLHSLVMDSQSVCYGQTFEDFASEFGYDTDSREAERIYNACRDTWSGMVRLGADFEKLGELFQDY